MATYFPDWTGDEFPPEKVDFNRFKWVDFAFAVPDENRQLKFESDNSEDLLKRLVSAAHSHGSKVKLSVGGWTGSRCFSDAVSNDANRREFVKNIVAMYHKFNLDGIDIDWEYPGVQGAGSNKVSPSDSAHFLLFLQHLRTQLPEGAKITAATQVTPFAGPDGAPMKDVSGFAKVLDWILIMNYDVWGASSTPGPNAPLRDGCHNSTQPDASAAASVKAWSSAGFPANQITLGLPSYGYVQTSTARRLVQRSRGAREGKLRIRQGDDGNNNEDDGGMQITDSDSGNVRVKGEGEGDDNGQVQFEQLLKEGAIKLSSDGNYVGAGGFSRLWDTCSSTPYLVSKNAKQVVTYDDPESLGMKAAFAKEAGLRGVNMFDVHGDTDDWVLTDAIRAGLGLD
ncbi:glycoside hydrolase [Ceratobasidium sp. AG-I]|nr:glycoside hydrolase [Ceratobasidium sp. AG-I]